jgi:hypothetical protein
MAGFVICFDYKYTSMPLIYKENSLFKDEKRWARPCLTSWPQIAAISSGARPPHEA